MTEDGCIVCKEELIYLERSETMTCSICNETFASNAKCKNGHFVCDNCHELEGFDFIETWCNNSQSTTPVEMANDIMRSPNIKLHGPEHHFLVPAVLITSYYNAVSKPEMIRKKLKTARQRAKNILGGFCGFYGSCGAGIGAGIFMSVVLNSTPLSKEEWGLSNLITSECLHKIALNGGPRCCKRDTYHALETAIGFIEQNLDVKLNTQKITCPYFNRNKECTRKDCEYFPTRHR